MAAKKAAPRRSSSALPWVIAGVAGATLVLVLVTGRRATGRSHPEPRPEAAGMGETVMPASFFTTNPHVLRTYQLARAIPGTLDGLYCNCHCKEELGHRSLLSCFQSQHGSGCDICLGEAETAARMQAEGKSLQEIRAQIDLAFSR